MNVETRLDSLSSIGSRAYLLRCFTVSATFISIASKSISYYLSIAPALFFTEKVGSLQLICQEVAPCFR